MAESMIEQPAISSSDTMAGLSHSEVHYFNRYIVTSGAAIAANWI